MDGWRQVRQVSTIFLYEYSLQSMKFKRNLNWKLEHAFEHACFCYVLHDANFSGIPFMYINSWTEYEVKLYLYWWLYLSRSCSQRDRQGPFNTCDASWLTSFPLNPLALGQYVNNQSRGKHQQTPDSYCNTGRKCKRVTGTCLMHRPSHGHLLLRCIVLWI